MAHKNLLQNVYLFKGLPTDQLDKINEISEVKTFNSGEDIFTQGDEATALYVIRYGSVKIHQKGSMGDYIEVATLGTGSHFGEMALVDGEERSASATAIEKTELVVLSYESLREVLDRHPTIAVHFYRELANFLCGRLRITTNDLSFARERNLSHF